LYYSISANKSHQQPNAAASQLHPCDHIEQSLQSKTESKFVTYSYQITAEIPYWLSWSHDAA